MHLSGRFRRLPVWMDLGISGSIFIGLPAFGIASAVTGVVEMGYAIHDRRLWWVVAASWVGAAVMALGVVWWFRNVRRTIRWFEFDGETLRYQVLFSRRVYSYRRSELREIRRGGSDVVRMYQLFFSDKNWAMAKDTGDDAPELVTALIGDAPIPPLKRRILWADIFFARKPEGESIQTARPWKCAGLVPNNTRLINDDFSHNLGHAPDAADLENWLKQFAEGKTSEDVIASFLGSADYYKEHTA